MTSENNQLQNSGRVRVSQSKIKRIRMGSIQERKSADVDWTTLEPVIQKNFVKLNE